MAEVNEVLALHRYFVWAEQMRMDYYRELDAQPPADPGIGVAFRVPYMSYWYAGLYVVVEGWRKLGLVDVEIDRLLDSPNVDSLRLYRNGAFHFQRKYFDTRFAGLISTERSAEWIFNLQNAFSRWFLDYLPRQIKR